MYIDVDISEDVLHYKAINDDGKLVGLLQVNPESTQYIIEGLYVDPEYREEGIATELLDDFLGRITPQILRPCTCTFSELDAGQELIEFFKNRDDFILIEAGKSYYVRISEFLNNPIISKVIEKGTSANVKALKDLETIELNRLLKELKELELDTVSESTDLINYYHPELSSVFVVDREVKAAVLVSDVQEGNAFIETVFFKDNGVTGIEVVADVVKKIADFDSDMNLSFFTINEKSEKLLDNLLENAWTVDKVTTYMANWLMI